MKQIIKVLILVEIQVVLVLLVILLLKQNALETKVFNTNKFVYELLLDKRVEELKVVKRDDIVIGEDYAPVTLFVYARYGCSACGKFFESVYPKLRDEYVSRGDLKIVIRQIVQRSRPQILYASKAALFAYREGCFDEFNSSIHSIDATLSGKIVDNIAMSLIDCSQEEYDEFMSDENSEQILLSKAAEVREAGISGSPTFIIGRERLVGTRSFAKFKALIEEKLTLDSCE